MKNMSFRRLLVALFAVVLLVGCEKEREGGDRLGREGTSNFVQANCKVDIQGNARDGLSVITFFSGFSLTSDSSQIKVPDNAMPQLIIVADNDNNVRMMYRGVIQAGDNININSHTTALAMVTCNPTVSMIGDSNFADMTSLIERLQSFSAFEEQVGARIAAGVDLFDTSNTQMIQSLNRVFDELLNSGKSPVGSTKDDDPLPWANYEPLEFEWRTPSNPGTTGRFYLRNFALVPSYYGKITSTSGMTKDIVVPTVDRYTLGSLSAGLLGVDVAHGDRVEVALYMNANNTIQLTNVNDSRAILDFGAHFVGDVLTALSLPFADDACKDIIRQVGQFVCSAVTDDSPLACKTIANTALQSILEWAARKVEENFLEASTKVWAKKMCDIGMKRILAFYNTTIGVTNLVARVSYWVAYHDDISFCIYYGQDGKSMLVDECKDDMYTVAYEVGAGTRNTDGSASYNMNIFLGGDTRGLANADEYGYYINYSNYYEYHSVTRLNSSMYDYPYTYTLTINQEMFHNVGNQRVAQGYKVGFYVVTDNRDHIAYYDEHEIEGLIYPEDPDDPEDPEDPDDPDDPEDPEEPCGCNITAGDWVDLGLPSGKRWASRNVGASSPTDYGNYYTWDDAAAMANVPTEAEFEELIDNTTHSWVTLNGVNGCCFTGRNGNSIFLPAAGCRYCLGGVNTVGSCGNYWSSTPGVSEGAWLLFFGSGGVDMDLDYRSNGYSVRLVQD